MILALGATSPNTEHSFPYFYGMGYGYGRRIMPRKSASDIPMVQVEIRDSIFLSPAAQRIIEQAERITNMNIR